MILVAQTPANYHPGLQYLSTLDHLLIDHKVKMSAEFSGFEGNKKYKIRDNQGKNVYFAVEENNSWDKCWRGNRRNFDIRILDYYQNEVMHVTRHLTNRRVQEMKVFSPPGRLIGTVKQKLADCNSGGRLNVKNENGQTIFKIKKPNGWGMQQELKVLSRDMSTEVGIISKKRRDSTNAKILGISFPLDLDVRMKAVLIGACFMLDFMYFKRGGQSNPKSDDTVM